MKVPEMSTKSLLIGLGLIATMALTGCQTTREVLEVGEAGEKNPGPCPRAFALYDAARIINFEGKESFSNVGFTGEFQAVRSLCRYYGDRPIVADLEMDIEFGRGPAAQGSQGVYNYFVAVTRKNIDVIEKETFPISVTFPAGQDRVTVTEKISEIVIPRANDNTSGVNFEIIVGFDVTTEQRAFNAAGKRFRPSVGKNK